LDGRRKKRKEGKGKIRNSKTRLKAEVRECVLRWRSWGVGRAKARGYRDRGGEM